eukprot:Em0001g3107a
MFGPTDDVIRFFRTRNLLASSVQCTSLNGGYTEGTWVYTSRVESHEWCQKPMLECTRSDGMILVNKWESADEKLKWLRVRLTGKALAAFSRCSEAVRNDYGECMKALAKRFNPDSKREVYVAELHSRNRRKEEDWATYADILKGLADKAYPDLEEAARERLALNQFLGELDKPQVAFGVRQGRPKSLDEAVSLTIELESYIGGSHGKPARVNFSQVDAELPNASASTTVAEEQERSGVLAVTLQSINERLQRLELRLKNSEAITDKGSLSRKN